MKDVGGKIFNPNGLSLVKLQYIFCILQSKIRAYIYGSRLTFKGQRTVAENLHFSPEFFGLTSLLF